MIDGGAIGEMLGYCMRGDVGIVGAKLLYEDETVSYTHLDVYKRQELGAVEKSKTVPFFCKELFKVLAGKSGSSVICLLYTSVVKDNVYLFTVANGAMWRCV